MKSFKLISTLSVVASFLAGILGVNVASAAGPAAIDLGTAGNFAILAKSGISTTGATAITGNIGVSPIAASAMTGFSLVMDSTNTFAASTRIVGKAYAADYATPTPAMMTTAVSDMETAYTSAAGRTNPTATELSAGNLGDATLNPGLYQWSTDVTIPTDLTLSGDSNDIWIFQIAQKLTTSSATKIILSGGAKAANIFWQVGGQTTLGSGSTFTGTILDKTAIVLETGAVLNGRALAQTAVTLDANTITRAGAASISAPTTTNANANTNTGSVAGANTNGTTAGPVTPSLPNTGVVPMSSRSMPWQAPLALAVVGAIVVLVVKTRTRPQHS